MNDVEEKIRHALMKVNDPELGIDIVNLGLVYGIDVTKDAVVITMTLTTPGCPLLPYFQEQIVSHTKQASGLANVSIDLTFDPPWSPDKMTPQAKKEMALLRG